MAEWLSKFGLSQYAQLFAENDIDYSVLPDLTDADLEKLGVSLGHRKKLRRAIATLGPADDTDPTTALESFATEQIFAPQQREPELRHITVVFCDLVGSIQLAETLDPEDLQSLTEVYRHACRTAIKHYAGEVARYFGDGVMAFFGWPHAHEDDAHRAVHAALEIISEVSGLSGPATLACRVGVCSGPVVISNSGEGTTGLVDAVGETPNIAARLQSLAAINTVLISESTRRLVSTAFDMQDMGWHTLKGMSEAIRVHRVVAAKNRASRFEASRSGFLTPLVGRSTELSLLLDRWQKVKAGDGQVILLSGVAGVGKSRLVHELRSKIEREPHIALHHQCSPYHVQSAFFPVIKHIEHSAQLDGTDVETEKLARLTAYLPDALACPAETVLLLANLLSISGENDQELAELSSQQIKNKTIATLVEMLLSFSRQQPTLCIFEDAHWLDPSTLELLELMINRIGRARVLLLVSCRPEFRPPWADYPNVTSHSLTRLAQNEVKLMIGDLLRGGSIPDRLLDKIIEKADGVPLFVEELTSSTLTASSQGGPSDPNSSHGALKVPETLSDALMERLDRVAPSRRIAQLAAVIGREFSYDVLAAASRLDPDQMQSALAQLEQADIIYKLGVSPSVRFAFKHVLLRDAIYDSLLRSKRQQSHAEVAAVLERDFPDLLETEPELLAYHYQEAGNSEAAVRYWFQAGQRACAQSAHVEAIASFRSALQILSSLPDKPERNAQEIRLQLALGIPLIAVRGYASSETRDAFSRARTLSLNVGDVPAYVQSLFGLWGHAWMGGKNDEALRMAQEFLTRSRESSDPVLPLVAHRIMGSSLLTLGEFRSSADHFDKSIMLSEGQEKQPLRGRFMVEPQTASLLLLSWDLWFLGYPDQALARVFEAIAFAHDLRDPYTIAFAYYMASVVHLFRGEAALALEKADKSFAISEEQRFSLYSILSRVSRGCAIGELGDMGRARSEIAIGLEEARLNSVGYMLPMMQSWQADLYSKMGDHEQALSIVEAILVDTGDVTGRAWESELHRQKARLLLLLNASNVGEAEDRLQKSIEVARQQGAKWLELRTCTSLAELWHRQGRHADAHILLDSICQFLKEGADTADMRRVHDLRNRLH